MRGDKGYDPVIIKVYFERYEEAKGCFLEVIGELAMQPDWAGEAAGKRERFMKPELHINKAARFITIANQMSPERDYEAIMWANLHVSTHLINAIFHVNELTGEDFDFEHTWHLYRFPDEERLRAGLDIDMQELLDTLTVFEALRTTYVRGPGPYGVEVFHRNFDDVDRVRAIA